MAQAHAEKRMRLYYLPNASSLFPHIVLVEAGLPFDAVRVDEHTKIMDGGGDYRSVNPLGSVPALQLGDGTVLTEAAAIAQYACDQVPAKKLAPPNGTLDRAKLQSWLNFISAEMHLGCFCPLFDREIPPAVKTIFRRHSTAASLTWNAILARTHICWATASRSPMSISSSCRIGPGR